MECPRCRQVLASPDACPSCGWLAAPPDDEWPEPVAPIDATGVDRDPPHDTWEPRREEAPSEPTRPPDTSGSGRDVEMETGSTGSAGTDADPKPGSASAGPQAEGEAQNRAKTNFVLHGDTGTVIVMNGDHAVFGTGTQAPGAAEKEASLLAVTSEFELNDRRLESLDTEAAERYARAAAEQGVLLVSCHDQDTARAAVQAVVEAMEPAPAEARLLSFDMLGGDQRSLTIHGLLQCDDTDGKTAVVADAFSTGAQMFLDSLLSARGAWFGTGLARALRDRELTLVCAAEPQRYAAFCRSGEKALFPHWTVPFLEPFLEREFPDDHAALQSSILQQRADGRWSRDDAEFWEQLRTFRVQGRLREVVESGGAPPKPPIQFDKQGPVHQVVLFTGAFFTSLGPVDFERVVIALLGDATTLRPVAPAPADGAAAVAPEFQEVPLLQLWREAPDRIKGECGMEVLRDPAAGAVVEFTDPGTREALKERLERDHPFRLQAAFNALLDAGLLFTGSDAVAENVVRLTAHMVERHPETYGRDWVTGMLMLGRARAAEVLPARRIVWRSAELLRALLARPAVRPLVDGVLDGFLRLREFETVFELVKQLRFAPEFDPLRWLRQLVDRGSADARAMVGRFLYRELASLGEQVYATLHALSEWLPAEERGARSPSNRLALELLVQYAVNTAARFDPKDFGARPTRYPLLAVSGDAVSRDLGLLVRWLLHPDTADLVRDEAQRPGMPRLLAALLAKWTFILFGPGAAPALPGPEGVEPGEGPDDSPERVFTVLLAAIAAGTRTPAGRALRREMLAFWEEMKRQLIPAPGMTRAEREELAWKRGHLRVLLLRFRALHADPPAVAAGA